MNTSYLLAITDQDTVGFLLVLRAYVSDDQIKVSERRQDFQILK